jgi:hypothetical protein
MFCGVVFFSLEYHYYKMEKIHNPAVEQTILFFYRVADPDPQARMFLGHQEPLVSGTDPDPSIIKQKK